ncbi:hypothetical protein B0O99DRAFT_589582 [Bisporella sp. PMI_857]|nr:hypothetical protein B0O99DRAFT_589582 [Bisporella sp. PMI_857]
MVIFRQLQMFTYVTQLVGLVSAFSHGPVCKSVPGSNLWPNDRAWSALNNSISGRLIKTVPPGSVCHPTQPTFNPLACPSVQAGWLTSQWHTDNPVSSIINNWNNDTCLPLPALPCSGKGYPIYVVNATCAADVKKGVDFARANHIRLNVKGTGHDYLGRSSAPNSLSIWTHHIRGISFHDGFKPQECRNTIEGHAITVGAGTQMLEIDREAHLRNLTIVSGGGGTVGVGGYLTGGGHAALSSTYGLGADQVLELEIVTPSGKILTINECQHKDLFWAVRGGGGSTFGVITSVTIRAFPSTKFVTASLFLGTAPGGEGYWDVITHIVSRYPDLISQGISGYTFIAPNFLSEDFNITSPVDGYYGILMLPLLHPSNSSESLLTALNNVVASATAPYPGQIFSSISTTTYDDFWGYYEPNNGPQDAGYDQITVSRLLDGKALADREGLKKAFKTITSDGTAAGLYLVGGANVFNAKPRGGSNAVNPAWRKAYVHALSGGRWTPFDYAKKAEVENKLTNVWGKALRELAPDMGAYINEADANEPNFQQAFWGDNYPRLLAIKRRVDPTDLLWCTPCVGNERWALVDGVLCKV